MRLVDDDVLKIIGRELREALVTHERLNGSDDDAVPGGKTALFCLFDRAAQSCRFKNLIGCLVEQLATVSEDEHACAVRHTILRDGREDDGLAGSCRQDKKRFLLPVLPFLLHLIARLDLVRSELHISYRMNRASTYAAELQTSAAPACRRRRPEVGTYNQRFGL